MDAAEQESLEINLIFSVGFKEKIKKMQLNNFY